MRFANWIERLLRPRIRLAGRDCPAYGALLSVGLVFGATVAIWLAWSRNESLTVTIAAFAGALAGTLALAYATVAATGRERFKFFHYQVAGLLSGGTVTAILGRAPLPFLDLLSVSLAVVHIFGRMGCLMAGCCHGLPHHRGLRYGPRQVDNGLSWGLRGVPLLPVPALEALVSLLLALAAMRLVLTGRPGEALATYVAGYALARFFLEYWRGDSDRPYMGGLSEAQWSAALLLAMTSIAQGLGFVPQPAGMPAWVALTLLLAGPCWSWMRPAGDRELLSSRHLTEIAGIVFRPSPDRGGRGSGGVTIETTSRRLIVSSGLERDGLGRETFHYSFSLSGEPLPLRTAESLSRWLLRLRHPSWSHELILGSHGVFHLLVRPPRTGNRAASAAALAEALPGGLN